MKSYMSEDDIEQNAIAHFEQLYGIAHLNCYHLSAAQTGRTSEQEIVMDERLRRALRQLNPHLPEVALQQAYDRLTENRRYQSSNTANQEIYALLREGVSVQYLNAHHRTQTETVRVLDYAQPRQNDFLLVSQLWIQGEVYRLRPDLILYINGLPLVFIELKESKRDVREAYDDNLTRYREAIPQLFWYNVACVLSNARHTLVGAFEADYEFFKPWLRAYEQEPLDRPKIVQHEASLSYAIKSLLAPATLLDYVENFVVFHENTKVIAQNHQFLGVNRGIESLKNRLEADRTGANPEDKGKLGVFWHTQGSGKSYSMVFLARKIFRQLTGNFTFLIITDREDLDTQIYKTFLRTGNFDKNAVVQPRNSEHLRELLGGNSRFVFTLIQKFRYDKGKTYPLLSTRNDIIVIVDEAHRTQYADLAENLRTGLPNAQFLAFTGTPLMGSAQKTHKWFGTQISRYDFKQSIEDQATVPLYYHKRVPEVLIQNDNLNEEFEEILTDENITPEQQRKLERDFAQEMEVIKRDDRLDTIARDIVAHFPARGYLGKALVISIDKFTAVKMYDKVEHFRRQRLKELVGEIRQTQDPDTRQELERQRDFLKSTEMAVVVSEGDKTEEDKFKKAGLDIKLHRDRMAQKDAEGRDIEDQFKAPEHPLRLVFVCSMWLTGFDAPTVSTLYLDKPMRGHTLMQTIARANRVTSFYIGGVAKTNGEIIDYYNVFRNLKRAFAEYVPDSSEEDAPEEAPVQEKPQLEQTLQAAVVECRTFLEGLGFTLKRLSPKKKPLEKLLRFRYLRTNCSKKTTGKRRFKYTKIQ
jgi:type I restriction enzyme, R subunit